VASLALLVVEPLQNLPQRLQLRERLVATREALTEIGVGHPARNIDDRLIDFEFQAGGKIVPHLAYDLAFPTKERV